MAALVGEGKGGAGAAETEPAFRNLEFFTLVKQWVWKECLSLP